MDRGAWQAVVPEVTKSQTRLSMRARARTHTLDTQSVHHHKVPINYMVLSRAVASVNLYFKRMPPFAFVCGREFAQDE